MPDKTRELYGPAYQEAIDALKDIEHRHLVAIHELLYSGCPPCEQCERLAHYIKGRLREPENYT